MKTSWDNLLLEISEKKNVLWKAIFTKPINNIYVYLGEFQQIMEFFLKDISLLATLKFEVYVCIYASPRYQKVRVICPSVELKISLMGETKMQAYLLLHFYHSDLISQIYKIISLKYLIPLSPIWFYPPSYHKQDQYFPLGKLNTMLQIPPLSFALQAFLFLLSDSENSDLL